MEQTKVVSTQSLRALDYLNALLAHVREGAGPYLAIYLLTTHHWDPSSIGVAMSAMGIGTVLAQTPCGGFIDTLKQKRLLIALAALLVGVSCAALTVFSNVEFVILIQTLNGVAVAMFPPAVAAITLGLVGPTLFAPRIGRNEAFTHAGNVGAAALTGVAGYVLGPAWIFYLVTMLAIASIVSVYCVREQDIDHALARAAVPQIHAPGETASGITTLLSNRTLLMFALSSTLFHFANAAMLPLAGQLLSHDSARSASLSMSACIIAAQVVMVPVAALAGTWAQRWGRKPVFLIAFAALPIRGLLYTLGDDPLFIVAVQLLDGIGAGIFGVLWLTVVADLMAGTGRYNLALGAIATAQGIGTVLSNLAAGYVVQGWGYHAGFVFLAGVAALALCLFAWAMPETGPSHAIPVTARMYSSDFPSSS